MKYLRFWGIAVSLLMILLLVSCTGIPREEYARVADAATKAQTEAISLKAERDTLNNELQGVKSTLAATTAKENELKAEIEKLKADVAAQRTINLSTTDDLKNISSPRHFESLTELNDWLRKDKTDTEYGSENLGNISFILQIKAMRDGYLLPAWVYTDDEYIYFGNSAFIEDETYNVYAYDDSIEFYDYGPVLSSRPLPLE